MWKSDPKTAYFWATVSTSFLAYSFQAAFFPILRDLKHPTNKNGLLFSGGGIGVCMIIYITVGFLGVYLFGVQTEGNVLLNFNGIPTWPSYVLRCCFSVVICIHTPFVLFVGKEALLSIIGQIILVENNNIKPKGQRATQDEVKNHSIKV